MRRGEVRKLLFWEQTTNQLKPYLSHPPPTRTRRLINPGKKKPGGKGRVRHKQA